MKNLRFRWVPVFAWKELAAFTSAEELFRAVGNRHEKREQRRKARKHPSQRRVWIRLPRRTEKTQGESEDVSLST